MHRDLEQIRLPRWGRVGAMAGVVPWLVLDPSGVPVEPIRRYLCDFTARGNSASSVRSYAYGLLRWWRWLISVEVSWDRATPAEVCDLVLWLQQAVKLRTSARTVSAASAGTLNPITRKRYLGDRYAVRTIRHSNAVVRAFYDFWLELGEGPLINPVQVERRGHRSNAHHNPLEPFAPAGRVRYNPKLPKQQPREIPHRQWRELFGA